MWYNDDNYMPSNFTTIGDIIAKKYTKKPPAYEWQDLALRIIKELNVPAFKRNAVFKVCRDHSREVVQQAMNDTKELCHTGQKWAYFFKIISGG